MTHSAGKLFAHTSIYFVGNLLRRIVSFIMLPIYTRYLSPSDYGVIELLSTVLDFVGIIVGLRVAEALFRFYSEYDNVREKKEVISTGLLLVALLNLLGILIVYAFSQPIALMLFDNSASARLLVLYSFTLLGAALIEIPMAYLRALQRPWLFVLFSTVHLLTQLSLNIYFVVFMDMRVEGVVYSAVISTAISSLILLIYTSRHMAYRFSVGKAKQLIAFSWPLILTSVISFYIVFGDRYFLKFYRGLAEVGIYSLGYKFGFLLSFVVAGPFYSYWQTERYEIVKHNNAETILRDVMLVFTLVVAIFVVVLSITVKDILRVMSAPSFWPAYKVVPIILLAYAFDALSNFTKLGILLQKRTSLLIYANLFSAVVITAGYVVLIPRMGATGAAVATLSAYFVRFLWITRVSQKLYRLDIPWKEFSLITLSGIFIYGLSLFGPGDIFTSMLFNAFLILIFIASIFCLPILPVGLKNAFLSGLRHPKLTLRNYVRSLAG